MFVSSFHVVPDICFQYHPYVTCNITQKTAVKHFS